jgi:uncharacterized RDD family membrane protein YckC/DNA-directed RNA polymerase subunit M/transcription elongation factor TFIIS
MTIRFDCQFCGKTLKADDAKAGKKVKCPSCEGLLSIPDLPASAESTLPEAEHLDDEIAEGSSKTAEIATGKRTIPCPMCDEPISPRETTCPYCGEEIKAKQKRRSRGPIADPMKRLMGAIVDLLATGLLMAPGIGLMVAGAAAMQDESEPPMLLIIGILLIGLGLFAGFAIQLYLLIKSSQSIGKYFMKIQILDYETNKPADLVKTLLLRTFVNGLIGQFTCAPLYFLVDSLFVFNDERRCLHDQIAGTYVVEIAES